MTTQYVYRAVNAGGGMVSGELSSLSRAAALDSLGREGLIPVELQERSVNRPSGGSGWLTRLLNSSRASHRVTAHQLQALTQSLAALLNAGLMVDRALIIAASLNAVPAVRRLTESLLQSVRTGKTLSQAFGLSGQALPPYYVSMVEAGEMGGALPVALGRLAELQQRHLNMRERIRSALIYPGLLSAVMVFTVIVLLTFVLPRFEQMFTESQAQLPWSTRAVLSAGRWMADWWWLALSGTAAAGVTLSSWLRTIRGRKWLHGWLLRTRMVMQLPLFISTARLLRTVSTLTQNGLPLPSALRVAKGTLANESLVAKLGQVSREVQAGERLSVALMHAEVFPAVATQLARVGEETGRLDEMLLAAAEFLEYESQLKLERLLTLAVPLMTVFMGLLVAGLIGSVLIGLLSINDLAF